MNLVPYMRTLQKLDVTFTVTFRLDSVRATGTGCVAAVGSDYGGVAKDPAHGPGGRQPRHIAPR